MSTNPEYQEQARRLNKIRTLAGQAQQAAHGSSGEHFHHSDAASNQQGANRQPVNDPLIHQGVYAPSGLDVLDILIQVYKRPDPQIQIGKVDSSAALVLCDADSPDCPIIYCSEPFENLTGYTSPEVIGQNCRFLQNPSGGHCSDLNILQKNSVAKREMRMSISRGREHQAQVTNFRKDGTPFLNILTLVPISWQGKKYIVGFQADAAGVHQ